MAAERGFRVVETKALLEIEEDALEAPPLQRGWRKELVGVVFLVVAAFATFGIGPSLLKPHNTFKSGDLAVRRLGDKATKKDACTKANLLAETSDKKPSDIFDLGPWKLQLPAASVKQENLDTYSLFPRATSSNICSGGFYAAVDNSEAVVVFYAPVAGITTSGSISPWVELRQMSSAPWPLSGRTSLTVVQKILHVPAVRKSFAFIQIFDQGSVGFAARAFVKVMTRKTRSGKTAMFVWYKKDPTKKTQIKYLSPCYIGEKYEFKVEVSNNVIVFTYKPEGRTQKTHTVDCSGASCIISDNLYWKTGASLQMATKEANDDYALMYMYKATISGDPNNKDD